MAPRRSSNLSRAASSPSLMSIIIRFLDKSSLISWSSSPSENWTWCETNFQMRRLSHWGRVWYPSLTWKSCTWAITICLTLRWACWLKASKSKLESKRSNSHTMIWVYQTVSSSSNPCSTSQTWPSYLWTVAIWLFLALKNWAPLWWTMKHLLTLACTRMRSMLRVPNKSPRCLSTRECSRLSASRIT